MESIIIRLEGGALARAGFLHIVAAVALYGAPATILDRTHFSHVFDETRHYRIFLPPDYESTSRRYPVIYWFHGFSERYNKPVTNPPHRNYDEGTDYGGDNISNFVSGHDVIVVKWDGYNPRTPDENYPRPYNVQPVETSRQFPLYFPELVRYIDANYRTIADREHRATSGLSMGGFMSFWIAGKYPDLVSSASNFMGSSEFVVGPREFPVEYRHDEMHGNYDGIRTRLVMGTQDFIRFYHRRMNLIWKFTRPDYETEEFESDHGTPGMAKTLAFHMRAFAQPLPRPAAWNHIDVYPEFSVWGWSVASDRRQPGLTELTNVSAAGFRSCVREWVPAGHVLANVKVRIVSAPLYPAGKEQSVTVMGLRDRAVTHSKRKADADGRLTFDLDGDEYEVGVGDGPIRAIAGFEVLGAGWAEDQHPVHLRVRMLDRASGKTSTVPYDFTISDPAREIAKVSVMGLPLEVPVFPAAERIGDFKIADGRAMPVFQRAVEREVMTLGAGNGDGVANAGERIAVLIPDGEAFRAAELFGNDSCVDLSTRASDIWGTYDHVGASVKYSLPLIRKDCAPGHVIRMLTRVQYPSKPDHIVRYGVVEVPVGRAVLLPVPVR